jgi:LPXTG-motif cell wall-anchored protein
VRLTGLALLTACVVKLFFYDFSTLDTPYRIASFLLLGLLLIGGSWVYTRFRKQLEGVL